MMCIYRFSDQRHLTKQTPTSSRIRQPVITIFFFKHHSYLKGKNDALFHKKRLKSFLKKNNTKNHNKRRNCIISIIVSFQFFKLYVQNRRPTSFVFHSQPKTRSCFIICLRACFDRNRFPIRWRCNYVALHVWRFSRCDRTQYFPFLVSGSSKCFTSFLWSQPHWFRVIIRWFLDVE